LRLSRAERKRAWRAAGWLLLARVALRVCQYSTLLPFLAHVKPARRSLANVEDCRVAMQRATRLVPGSRCLAQALAAAAMVRREGHAAELVLHVHFSAPRRFEAHASLTAGGVVVTGDGSAARWPAIARHTLGA
jgi:hypothetical protein